MRAVEQDLAPSYVRIVGVALGGILDAGGNFVDDWQRKDVSKSMDEVRIPFWPEPSDRSPLWAILFLLSAALIVAAVAVVYSVRRRREELAAAWRQFTLFMAEIGLEGEAAAFLRSFVTRWAAKDPLRAITDRSFFGACIDVEIQSLGKMPFDDLMQRGTLLRSLRDQLGFLPAPADQPLDSTRDLERGQTISLLLAPGTAVPWVSARIAEINDALVFVEAAEAKPMRRGEEIRCRVSRGGDARYEFELSFYDFDIGKRRLVCLHSRHAERTQDRSNARVSFLCPASVEILESAASSEEDTESLKTRPAAGQAEAEFTDVSATGVALLAGHALAPGTLLRFRLKLDRSKPLSVIARVVSSEQKSGQRYLVRAHYFGMSAFSRAKVARYVLYRQQNRMAPPR